MTLPKLTNLALAMVTVPILGVAAVTIGQGTQPSQVLGDMLSCPDGSTVQTAFTLSGDSFTATGPLVALDSQNVTVMGPSGNVTATLTVNAEVDAGLQPGMPVTVQGQLFDQGTTTVASTVRDACNEATEPPSPTPMATAEPSPALEPTATPTPEPEDQEVCNRGPGQAGELRLEINGHQMEIKRGAVVSFTDGALTVDTPAGPITAMITSNTKTMGDLSLASEVRVKGKVGDNGNIIAEEARALCPDAASEEQDNDEGDEDEGHERATPAVPAIPAVPGEHGDRATPAIPAIPAVPPHHDDHQGNDHEDNDNGGHGGGNSGHGGGGEHD